MPANANISASEARRRKRKEAYGRHLADQQARIDRLSQQLLSGAATGQPADRETVERVRETAVRQETRFYGPETVWQDGQPMIAGVGGALIPHPGNMKDADDFAQETADRGAYTKASQQLWNSMRVAYPGIDPASVSAATQLLVQSSGMSVRELAELANDPSVRMELIDRIADTAQKVERYAAANANTPADDTGRAVGFDYSGTQRTTAQQMPSNATAARPVTPQQQPEADQGESISDMIRKTQVQMGIANPTSGDNE